MREREKNLLSRARTKEPPIVGGSSALCAHRCLRTGKASPGTHRPGTDGRQMA